MSYKSALSKNNKTKVTKNETAHLDTTFDECTTSKQNSGRDNTKTFDINDSFVEMTNFFHKNGYIIIENSLSQEEITNLRTDLNNLDNQEKRRQGGKNIGNKHLMHKCFFEKSQAMVKFISDNKLVDFVQHLISDVPNGRGNNLTAHLIHNNAFIVPINGRGQAPSWHTDDALQNVVISEGHSLPEYIKLPVMVVTCMIWLSDCNAPENGPTYVVPGSHRLGKCLDTEYADKNGIPTCGKSGTVVIINNQLWHRGCENTSNIARETIQLTFGRRIISHMFKSIMDYQMPQHVTKNMDNKTKERFGYLQGGAYS